MTGWFQCPLFEGFSEAEILALHGGNPTCRHYKAGELVAMQGSVYDSLLIVSEGMVRGEMTDPAGRTTLIEEIRAPRAIAPAFLYATENRLPVAILAAQPSAIVQIRRSVFTEMMRMDARLLTNYLRSMADRSRFLSEKLRMQRFGTIRSKLARYLLELSVRLSAGNSPVEAFRLPHTQQQLADLFGVTRPALARCLSMMEKEGMIEAKGKEIRILDRQRLRQV